MLIIETLIDNSRVLNSQIYEMFTSISDIVQDIWGISMCVHIQFQSIGVLFVCFLMHLPVLCLQIRISLLPLWFTAGMFKSYQIVYI